MYEAAVSIAKMRNSMAQPKFIDSVIKNTPEQTGINRSIDMNGKQKACHRATKYSTRDVKFCFKKVFSLLTNAFYLSTLCIFVQK